VVKTNQLTDRPTCPPRAKLGGVFEDRSAGYGARIKRDLLGALVLLQARTEVER
jgi:hypothetical protein